ncbi:MAG: T9SS type A sorting domain-containing protein [Bacteroidetes bacterium]|nr:T9SS type A sorting domain-containing protein [Bacteroidota bacterium]
MHNYNATSIPASANISWDANSTLEFIGITSATSITNLSGQTFGHFKWNNASQTSNCALNTSFTVAGNLEINTSGSGSLILGSSGGPFTLTLNGDYLQTGGTFNLYSGGTAPGTLDMTTGNFDQTSGTFRSSGSYGILRFSKASGTQTFSQGGSITDYARVEKTAAGTLEFLSDATWPTQVTASSGTISFGSVSARTLTLQTTSLALNFSGSTIDMSGGNLAHKVLYSNSAGACTFTGPTTFTHGTDDAFEVSAGTGTLTLGNDITFNHLVVTGGTLYSGAVLRNIIVDGNLSGAGTLRMNGAGLAHTLTLNGASNAIGTFTTTTGSGSIVTYARAGDQDVFETINYINLAFSNGGNKSLTGSSTVKTNLTLNSGLVLLGSYNLTMSATTGVIDGNAPSETNMVVTDGSGQLVKTFATGNTAAFTFPVGDNSGTAEYSPVIIDFSANSVSGTVGVNVSDTKHPADAASDYISRYWHFTTASLTNYTYIANYYYTDADENGTEADLKVNRYDNSTTAWSEDATSSVNTGSNILTSSALTQATGPLNNMDYTGRKHVELYYRTKNSGNWDAIGTDQTWEVSSDPAFVSPAPVDALVAPTNSNSVGITIRNGHTVTLTALSYADQLTVETGGTLDLSTFNLYLYDNGSPDILIDGTVQATSGQLYAQVASVNININGTFKTADANGFSTATTTSIRSTNSPVIAVGANAIVEYNGAAQTITNSAAFGGYPYLVLSGSDVKTMGNNITVVSELSNTAGIELAIGAFTLTLNGAFSGTGTITGGGSSNLTITGSGSIGTAYFTDGSRTMQNLTINRAGQNLTLGTDLSVSGTLTLTNGNIITDATNLLTITNTAAGAISGGSASSYIYGPLARTLPASLAAGSTYSFPVAKSAYKPFEMIDPTTSADGTITVTTEVFDDDCGGTPGSGVDYLSTTRYWKAEYTGAGELTSTQVRLTEAGLTNDDCIAKSADLTGTYEDIGSNSIGATITSDAITSFSHFAVGRRLNMVYSSCTTTQNTTSCVAKPSNDQEIIAVQIVTTGGPANPVSATSFTFNTNGSSNPTGDITSAKLWFTGTSNSFATTSQLGSTFASPNGSFVINGFSQALAYGTNYFWLTYDVPGTATNGNVLDAECNSLTVGSARTPTTQAPAGSRPISNYATLPYYQSFDGTWVNKNNTEDVPDGFWLTAPATGDNSWRRQDRGVATAAWSSSSGGGGIPYSGSGGSARFHTYNTPNGIKGTIDLYIDLSPGGTKKLYFRYYNNSGTDNLVVKLSSDGGSSFPVTLTPSPLGSPLGVSSTWSTQTVDMTAYSSATSVIRFEATSDFGASDIAIDEVRVQILSTPTYATLPYTQNFDGIWLDRGPGNSNDIPDVNWTNVPEIGANSWRRQNEGSLGDWQNPSSGIVSPYGGNGGCADFHSYMTTLTGDLLLYVDLSLAGTKEFSFEYKNTSGTDALQIKLSSDGGSSFPVTLSSLTTTSGWITYVVDMTSYSSATSVLRFRATGDNGFTDLAIDNVRIKGIPDPVYATVPYCQTFEGTWLDRSTYEDIPDNSWITTPSTGNNSWRRQNRGSTADWTSSGSGLVTPSGSTGAADFHSYITTATGSLDLYIDLSAAGNKLLTYKYYNNSGTDQMLVQLSTNGGSSFSTLETRTTQGSTCVPGWLTTSIDLGAESSPTCVIRFKATGDNGLNDIGIDDVCVTILPDPDYASLPFSEDFEDTWTDRFGIKDIPDSYWVANPGWGDNSWRRQNEGCPADWSSASSGIVSPSGSTGAADFHSYITSSSGTLDLYVDFTPAGSKLLKFNYLNASGTDVLQIYLATDGGTVFNLIKTIGVETKDCNNNWIMEAIDLGTSTSATCVVRFKGTGDNGLNDIGIDNLSITVPAAQTYAAIPYTQDFEGSWIDRLGYKDVPSNYWSNTPYMGNNSWRRQNEGCYGDWSSAASGLVTPQGTGCADFHSYITGTNGTLDLFVDLSPVGFKRITFEYKNTSGSDQLEVLFSTNGGSSWTSMLTLGSGHNWSTQNIDFDNTISPTCVVRFKATGDAGLNDLAIDNINLRIITDVYTMDNDPETTCEGIFFDSGGNLADYGNSEDYTKTFYPTAGNSIVAVFESFATQAGTDLLYVHNGETTADPQVSGSPFSGSSLPSTIMAANVDGALTFHFVSDGATVNSGWKITITCKPNCSANPAAGEYCSVPTPICNLNGYCSSTADYDAEHSATDNTDEDYISGIADAWSPWTIENNSWLTFVANATSIDFDVWVENCTDGKGVQIGVFSTSDCETLTRIGDIWSPATETDGSFTINGLTVDETYYLMIDGYAGDVCGYTIGVSGSGAVVPNAGEDQSIESPDCAQLQGSGGTTYTWAPTATLDDPDISNPEACPSATTTYTVTVTGGSTDCPASGTDEVTVFVTGSLPVQLGGYAGDCMSDSVALKWITYSEEGNDYFMVESSADGIEWRELGRIPGAGNSNVTKLYHFSDRFPLCDNTLYRLSQTDYNGLHENLGVINVICDQQFPPGFQLFPNPFHDVVMIGLRNLDPAATTVIVVDIYGKEVFRQHIDEMKLVNDMFVLSASSYLNSGVYIVKIESGTFTGTIKLIRE